MADVSPNLMLPEQRDDLATRRLRVFERRYGTNALYLAYHAAFPLTLTSDLLYCLRENFVSDVPWYAVADVLLSGLCQPIGYDLYEMEGKTRNRLLSDLCNEFGEQRLKELANFMSEYIASRLLVKDNNRALVFGNRPKWTALAYISPDANEVINAIKQELQQLTASTDGKERIRWAALVESYADLLSEKGFQPLLLEWVQQTLDNQPIQDECTKLAAEMGVTLLSLKFKVAIITLADEQTEELQPFDFEVVNVDAHGQVIKREKQQAFYFVELLGNNNQVGFEESEKLKEKLNLSEEKDKLTKVIQELSQNLTYQQTTIDEQKTHFNIIKINERISEIDETLKNLPLQQAQLKPIGLEMVAIPGGTFIMGSPPEELEHQDDESPQHPVTVQPFFMGKYQVTQAQWRFAAQLPQINRQLKQDPSNFKGANRPVEQVSWEDAVEFCSRLSQYTGRTYRLPSEAEWEYACRAGTTTPFHFGQTITTDLANYDGNYAYGDGVKGIYRKETTEVGSFGVANNFGLYDMHGNIREWCQDDWHSNYEGAPTDGSAWISNNESNDSKLLRGGSWFNIPGHCRSAYRGYYYFGNYLIGFRVVCSGAART
ncbi:SUMF1/EgtB/PvdO family nonheme iron enzyme [Anabaena cylindrica UHCC 0172]|uniref:formylglycine-generating enzyme family protein n=1 Tax=Anabaena cylindrica TaxID=1165 RepID=UPI002B1ECB2F|nr:SUMF1/EgtB/PvdO family nonheme iron enzyme [Anabaena cylindrica]MEA5553296.1 SUMF1/EgtB/PvdO family nonheme iron enzyme [Anabaena cylindrica UHCC 0172]